MVMCCVPGCRSRSDRNSEYTHVDGIKVTFHSFPIQPERRLAWLRAIKRRGEKPNMLWIPKKNHYVVCSRHFTRDDFKQGLKNKRLSRLVVPSVFTKDMRGAKPEPPEKLHRKKVVPCSEIYPWYRSTYYQLEKCTSLEHREGCHLKKKSKPSKSLPMSSAENVEQIQKEGDSTLISKEINHTLLPLHPKLLEVWSCSENENNSKSTPNSCEIENLPSFMKQALIEKEEIERTYEDTNTSNNSISISNGNLQITNENVSAADACISTSNENLQSGELEVNEELDITNSNICNDFQANENSTKKNNVQGLNFNSISVPYCGSVVPPNVANSNPTHVFLPVITVPNKLSSAPRVEVSDASTFTDSYLDTVTVLQKKMEESKTRMIGYRKKLKLAHQKNRRCQARLMNIKHSIFSKLLIRQFISNDSNFNSNKEGCLLDRCSIKVCESSDTEQSEEDELDFE